MNRIPVLPTLLTLGNGICGFAAIAYASKITLGGSPPDATIDYYLLSAILILVAMIFDVLDGYAARLSRTASEFGGQLDSLCDAISFGVAPAFLLLRMGLEWNDKSHYVAKSVAIIAALYMACAILRLARFNTENTPDPSSHKRFKGLPSPAAAGCVVSVAVLRADLGASWSGFDPHVLHGFVLIWAPLGTLVAALLMVSRFSYPHMGRQLIRGRRQFQFIVQLVLLLALIALEPRLGVFFLFWTYALAGPVRSVLSKLRPHPTTEPTARLD